VVSRRKLALRRPGLLPASAMRRLACFVVAATMWISAGCARPPRPAYSFDAQPGAWELDSHEQQRAFNVERYNHAVHNERLELFEVRSAAPATTTAAFNALPNGPRGLPPLASPGAVDRAIGDEVLGNAAGFWVSQHGHDGNGEMQGAMFVVPRGRRFFAVRMHSSEDEFGQLQAWVRDIVTRNVRFPAPTP
jgi:hypothetical protein